MDENEKKIREKIFQNVSELFKLREQQPAFVPGTSPIPYAGRIYDADEMIALVDASLDFWLTSGRFAEQFEREFAAFLGMEHCLLTNYGSSANLLAVSAL